MSNKQIVVYKKTSDDWYPSYTIEQWGKNNMVVEVSLLALIGSEENDNQWRVCVWGGDDCGMERDFVDRESALAIFIAVAEMDDVTMTALRELEFVSA